MEVVSYRLRVRVVAPKYRPEKAARVRAHAAPRAAAKGERRVHFDGRRAVAAVLYERERLAPGARFAGPAIVEQFDATTVVPPGWTASVDAAANLVLTKGTGRHG